MRAGRALAPLLLAAGCAAWHAVVIPVASRSRAAAAATRIALSASAADDGDAPGEEELPPAYKCTDAKITRSLGEASGEPLNDRFLMAQRALSGEFSPSDDDRDTEHGTGLIEGLMDFPAEHTFRVVAQQTGDKDVAAELSELSREACGLAPTALKTEVRSSKYVSIEMRILVGSAAMVQDLHARFKSHPLVKFCF